MKDIERVALFQIDRTSKIAKQYSQRFFDEAGMGITVDQWVLLKIIEEHGEMSQRELAEQAKRDPASITRTVDLLQKKGLVNRDEIPNNRRQYQIVLTSEGQSFVQKHMNMVMSQREQSLKGFSTEEIQSLIEYLHRIQKNMEIVE